MIEEDANAATPLLATLQQNAPNPFNGSTLIRFDLPDDGWVELSVFDVAGQRVAVPLSGWRRAGRHAVLWDGRHARGHRMASGVYVYRLRTGSHTELRKLALVH